MNQLRLYEIYVAMSLHYSDKGSYDFLKYSGKTRVSEESFLKRNDKYFFEKYAKKFNTEDDAILYFAVNMAHDRKYIIKMSETEYDQFISYRDAIHYKFKSQINSLNVFDLFSIINGDIPKELLIVYDYCSNGMLFKNLDNQDNILWEDYKPNLLKYYPFVVKYMNLKEYKQDLLSIILENLQEQ